MNKSAIQKLQAIQNFEGLVEYLGDELDWPVADLDFEDLIFQYTPEEIGLDEKSAAVVTDIKRLRPLDDDQPWGIFFLELEPKKLPVVALRRLLNKMTLKQRATSNVATRTAWHADDILFISRFGESEERQLTFAHFAAPENKADLPVLKVLGWDRGDTALKMDHVAETLREKLVWPEDPTDTENWRQQWRAAFELKHKEVISTSKDMASRLAQLARGIRDSIQAILEVESENGPLRQTMAAFKAALVDDLDEAGFADTYAQTITYGLLSARIADPTKNTLDDLAAHMRTNPFLKELMESFINLGGRERAKGGVGLDFDELGVAEVVDLLDAANMKAVLRDFGDLNPQEDPVIHFFEGFLQEYDKSIRKDRGVFYTPRPVVSFIVRSVDELLRTEFGLEDGLADTATWGEMASRIDDLEIPEGATADEPFVQILDPATGTGTFLVEVIDLIQKTMIAKWQAESHDKTKIEMLWNAYVPEHLLPRLHGYELMMAPYAIAHMKIGLKLYETGYRFESGERARVYLTNALEPAQDFSGTLAFAIPALAHEAEAVNAIKRDPRFTVVIGNPPYSGVSSNITDAAQQVVHRYRFLNGKPLNERKLWLQNDYVKFLGFAHELILNTGAGCIGYITDSSYLDGPTFRGVRFNLLQDFSRLQVLNLHGSAKKLNTTLEAKFDQNVFDISQAVAIIHGIRLPKRDQHKLFAANLLGARQTKFDLLSNQDVSSVGWSTLTPAPPFFQFVETKRDGEAEFNSYYSIKAAFPLHSVGIQTSRDHLAIDFTRQELVEKIRDFSAPETSDAQIRERYFPGKKVRDYLAGDTRGWSLSAARKALFKVNSLESEIVGIHYRPFDFRFIFNSALLVDWPRPEVSEQMFSSSNLGLCLLRRTENARDYDYFSVSRDPISNHQASLKDGTYLLPLYFEPAAGRKGLFNKSQGRRPNFSADFLKAISVALQVPQTGEHGLPSGFIPEEIFHYIYAVFHSRSYRERYVEFLKIDFPRLPITWKLELFNELARLGGELVSMHLMESPKLIDRACQLQGTGEFRVEAVSYSKGTVWIDKAKTRGFKDVPEDVWNFHIGGYQVCEKWLKDRQAKGGKTPRPGRVLTDEDIEHYQKIVVALSETIRIMAEVDKVIEAHGGWPSAFVTDNEILSDSPAPAGEDAQQLDMI